MKRQQFINAVKDEMNILAESQKHWLIELNDHDKKFNNMLKLLTLLITINDSKV